MKGTALALGSIAALALGAAARSRAGSSSRHDFPDPHGILLYTLLPDRYRREGDFIADDHLEFMIDHRNLRLLPAIDWVDPHYLAPNPRSPLDPGRLQSIAQALHSGIPLPPLVITGGTREIIDGHHRRQAAIDAGIALVPVRWATPEKPRVSPRRP